ncbi:hypothetical protein J7T55_006172 [Diaporthe amygdali]|uniref:uncharacterized protein n=1 Tax=Phomopsis amygdali TaxID=1214568 RepID=UPI0022FE4901|nr:uncharacterized protein J7T55_006172 [Diaporthe amygdali]KAJ0124829.1 hypothetical protein J7T55_006172 [Diaporthe amygdali]
MATSLKRKHSELQAEVRQLRNSNAALNTLFQALRSRKAHEAGAILQSIREGDDVETIIQSMIAGDVLLQLQDCPKKSVGFHGIKIVLSETIQPTLVQSITWRKGTRLQYRHRLLKTLMQ